MGEDVDKYVVDVEKDFNPELLKTGNKLRKTIKENSEKKKKLEDDIVRIRLERDMIWYLNDFYRVCCIFFVITLVKHIHISFDYFDLLFS